MTNPVIPAEAVVWWVAKNRNEDGSVSIIGNFRDEVEAERWADVWNKSVTQSDTAFVERRL
jgi:hypothetical protein